VINIVLIVLGLCLGSFVNALVWRLQEQSKESKEQRAESRVKNNSEKLISQPSPLSPGDLSILKGRSMCPNCRHELAARDLIPIFSWISLKGKCRYCSQPISWQYPVVELLTAALFVFSYIFWPYGFGSLLSAHSSLLFVFWLVFLTGLVALAVYDLRWFLLPDKITYPLIGLALVQVLLVVFWFDGGLGALKDVSLSLVVGGGIFYALFQLSGGRWIGGGDVKLGALIGLILGQPQLSLLMIFVASVLGSVVSVPMLLTGHAKRDTHLPFGPFLILATIVVRLFGLSMIAWYKRQALGL
jgi:prepilin signal peptidase PulO-like enzyme (type II secretory pathway)